MSYRSLDRHNTGFTCPWDQRHYIRILPEDVDNTNPLEDTNSKVLRIKNHPAGAQDLFPAKDIVDAGFRQFVRYGIRRPDDPLIADSLKVIDAVLKVETLSDRPGIVTITMDTANAMTGPIHRMGARAVRGRF
jgi:GH15 family glucan-1,4-alpha-glucosidase